MGAFYYSPPFDAWNRDGFYEKHPELRWVRRDGTTAPRISYAFPETRAFALSLLEEVARASMRLTESPFFSPASAASGV